jgi:hypothetical protein
MKDSLIETSQLFAEIFYEPKRFRQLSWEQQGVIALEMYKEIERLRDRVDKLEKANKEYTL